MRAARKPTPVTGNVALRAMVERDELLKAALIDAVQRAAVASNGNLSDLADSLGLEPKHGTGRRHVLALIRALDLEAWLNRTWPSRADGGPAMWRK
jgi:hypothetical protein